MKRSKINKIIGNSLALLSVTSQITTTMAMDALFYKSKSNALGSFAAVAPSLENALRDHVTQGVGSSNDAIKEAALETSSVIIEKPSSWNTQSAVSQSQKLVAEVRKAKHAPGHPEDESDANHFSILVANGLKIAEEANVLSNQISPEILEIVNESFASKDESVQAAYQKILPSFYQSAQSILQSDSQSSESATGSIKFLENYNQGIDEKKIKIGHQEAQKAKNEMALTVNEFVKKEAKKDTVKKDKVNSSEHPSSEGDFNSEQRPGPTPLSMSMSFLAELGHSTNFDEDFKQDILRNIEAINKSGNQVDNTTLNSLIDALNDDVPLDMSSLFEDENFYENEKAAPTKDKHGSSSSSSEEPARKPTKVLASSESEDDNGPLIVADEAPKLETHPPAQLEAEPSLEQKITEALLQKMGYDAQDQANINAATYFLKIFIQDKMQKDDDLLKKVRAMIRQAKIEDIKNSFSAIQKFQIWNISPKPSERNIIQFSKNLIAYKTGQLLNDDYQKALANFIYEHNVLPLLLIKITNNLWTDDYQQLDKIKVKTMSIGKIEPFPEFLKNFTGNTTINSIIAFEDAILKDGDLFVSGKVASIKGISLLFAPE
ncbi:MAG: hypothetical protein ACOH2E_01010 [Candidatus Paracaedibacter sp.]